LLDYLSSDVFPKTLFGIKHIDIEGTATRNAS